MQVDQEIHEMLERFCVYAVDRSNFKCLTCIQMTEEIRNYS